MDVLDLVTPELKAKILPLNTQLKDFEKERDERRKTRRKTKAKAKEDAAVAAVATQATASTSGDVEMGSAPSTEPVAGVIEDEATARKREVGVLTSLVDPSLAADVGCSPHGLYELCGEQDLSSIISS